MALSLAGLSMLAAGCSESPSTDAVPAVGGAGATAGGSTAGGAAANGGSQTGGGAGASAGAPSGGAPVGGAPAAGAGGTGAAAGAGAVGGGAGGVATGGGAGSAAGGSGGTGGVAVGGGAGNAAGGSVDTGGCSSAFATDVVTETHDSIETVVNVRWTQAQAADEVWLEFDFEADNVMASPPQPATAGAHQEVVLGVPEDTEVSIRVVSRQGGIDTKTCDVTHTTGSAPTGNSGLPRPEIESYEPTLASDNRWMLGSVSTGGGGTYTDQHWIYIIDRQGRVVWYQQVFVEGENDLLLGGFWPRVVPDGTHIAFDQQRRGDEGYMLFTTLDLSYQNQIHMPGVGDGCTITDQGTVIYEDRDAVYEIDADGPGRLIWECDVGGGCYANAVNYDAESDSVVISFPNSNQVVEVDRASGAVLRRFGDHPDAYAFDPPDLGIDYNHWAHINEWGNFVVSSHYPGSQTRHMWMEYEIDDDTKTLHEFWIFETTGFPFPAQRGMVARLPSGHRLGNFGSQGVIAEVTEDKQVAWRVNFNRMVHNNVMVNDLYALNRGP